MVSAEDRVPYTVVERRGQTPPFDLVDENGEADDAVRVFLLELIACDKSPATIKTYVYALLGWFRFLGLREKAWRQAEPTDVRDYVPHLRGADDPYRHRRPDSVAPGSLNPRTGKATLAPGYKPATINHRLSVIKSFYTSLERRYDDVRSPVPLRPRRQAHHNPLDPWVHTGRDPYRQREPKRAPRAIPDDIYDEAFRSLDHDRDRAILSLLVSSACTLHDFRHTCALRLASDPEVALVDVQAHLRHKHLSTTERYLIARPEDVVRAVQRHQGRPDRAPPSPSPWRYDPSDLDALLGAGQP